ncbi:MAG: PD40 domain-containing protein [Candidatus Nealsonbacteria bacterium]|nr:PD40 domain-containing protein [Candidatus Nealsonbacteria bacterium]
MMLRLISFVAVSVALVMSVAEAATIEFLPPVHLGDTLNSAYHDWGPDISADGLTLYFSSERPPGGSSTGNIWVATRATTEDPFGPPVIVPDVNSLYHDTNPCISDDNLSLYFLSTRSTSGGNADIWRATRNFENDPFGTPALVSEVNSSSDDGGADISADGLTLYFSSNRGNGQGSYDLWQAVRPSVNDPFGEPTNMGSAVNSSSMEGHSSITGDDLTIYLERGGSSTRDIWVATREADTDPFGSPVSLGPTINSSAKDRTPTISSDGTTLIFASQRSGGLGGYDLWMTTAIPEPSTLILLVTGAFGLLTYAWRKRRS